MWRTLLFCIVILYTLPSYSTSVVYPWKGNRRPVCEALLAAGPEQVARQNINLYLNNRTLTLMAMTDATTVAWEKMGLRPPLLERKPVRLRVASDSAGVVAAIERDPEAPFDFIHFPREELRSWAPYGSGLIFIGYSTFPDEDGVRRVLQAQRYLDRVYVWLGLTVPCKRLAIYAGPILRGREIDVIDSRHCRVPMLGFQVQLAP